MPANDGYELIQEMLFARSDEMIFARWVAGYQQQFSLEEFKKKVKAPERTKHIRKKENEQSGLDIAKNVLNMRIDDGTI